jgi:addiction module HigA family antidote
MGLNFVVSPGTILKEYMDARNITQKDLASLTESSERHVSNLINGKIRLTEEFAIKLEHVFQDVKAEFWMELETAYRLHLLRNDDKEILKLKTIAEEFQFKYVFKGMKLPLKEQAFKMLDILGIDSFDKVDHKLEELSFSFMEDGGSEKAMFLWLKLCESEIDIQNEVDNLPPFTISGLKDNLKTFKELMYTQDFELAIDNLRRFSNELGIIFVFHESIPNAKIRGAVRIINDRPVLFCSDRYKRLDTLYFAFIHEIGHIINKEVSDQKYQIVIEEDEEQLANDFARAFFIEGDEYKKFIEQHAEIKAEDIVVFSKKNAIIPDVLIGFLEHDKIIEHGKFNYLKGKL